MARFIFDVHDDGPALWGENAFEAAQLTDIEHHARRLVSQAQARQAKRGVDGALTTVFVHDESKGLVLTAYGRPGEDVRLVWTLG